MLIFTHIESAYSAVGISIPRDFSALEWDGLATTNPSDNISLCIYITAGEGTHYSIKATSNTGAVYKVASGSLPAIEYEVYWNDSATANGNQRLAVAGNWYTGFGNPSTVNPCASSNANVQIKFYGAALGSAKAGSYGGDLVISVEATT